MYLYSYIFIHNDNAKVSVSTQMSEAKQTLGKISRTMDVSNSSLILFQLSLRSQDINPLQMFIQLENSKSCA